MKRTLLILGAAVLVLVGAFYALNAYIYSEKQGHDTVYEPYRATLSGTFVCLPHADPSGPQTDECAFGLQTEQGEYYAVDFYLMSQIPPPFSVGDYITASGVVTPIENLSTHQWEKYDIRGTFSVTNSVQTDAGDSEEPSESVLAKPCYVGGCSGQLCSDAPGMVSTCEYREEYACYASATCEHQVSGLCGWTETSELRACLDTASR